MWINYSLLILMFNVCNERIHYLYVVYSITFTAKKLWHHMFIKLIIFDKKINLNSLKFQKLFYEEIIKLIKLLLWTKIKKNLFKNPKLITNKIVNGT